LGARETAQIILEDERRTSNAQRPTSNEKQTSNGEHLFQTERSLHFLEPQNIEQGISHVEVIPFTFCSSIFKKGVESTHSKKCKMKDAKESNS